MDAGLLQQTFICPEPRFLDYPLFTREPSETWSELAWRPMQVQIKFLRRFREVAIGDPVVLANPDLIDKLRVAVYPSIPFPARTVGSPFCVFRFLPEPCGASAPDPRLRHRLGVLQ
jgi:hypothetical protein